MCPARIGVLSVLLVLLLGFCNLANCYRELSVENPDLCSPNKKSYIKLGSGAKSGLIVTQKRLEVHNIDWSSHFHCKFQIQAPHPFIHGDRNGLFAVIQSMAFRRSPETGECIDYVQFKKKTGEKSIKHCGDIKASVVMGRDVLDLGQEATNAFYDQLGEIDVIIFVEKTALESGQVTDINMVFTTYKSCDHASSNDMPCDKYLHRDKCIFMNFINDGNFNCPFYGCSDEDGCFSVEEDPSVKKESLGNKVLIGSVSSLLLTFGIFICCIYMCKKYGKLCWSEDFARSTVHSSQPESVEVYNVESTSASTTQTTPSAPQEDKDLPPSYDSLFPSR